MIHHSFRSPRSLSFKSTVGMFILLGLGIPGNTLNGAQAADEPKPSEKGAEKIAVTTTDKSAAAGTPEKDAKKAVEPSASKVSEKSDAPEKKVVHTAEAPSACLIDKDALEDLKNLRETNDIRQSELQAKEAELKTREQALSEQLKKIEEVRDAISKVQVTKKKETAERVGKLVETLLTMSPKAAAKLLASLNDDLAVSILAEMDTQRLAKIMNLMDSTRSSKLSELLTGSLDRNKTSSPKGGV